MPDAILALNAGSSSVKFGLFGIGDGNDPVVITKGEIEDRGIGFSARGEALGGLVDRLEAEVRDYTLIAVGHRIVHGGTRFVEPICLSDDIIDALDDLTPLAPLHQPRSLEPVRALRSLRPDLLQIGCFDTAFHHNLAPPVSRFAIPRIYETKGVRRYGFHGLSYDYIARRLAEISPELTSKRTVVAHLGNGASLCALRNGLSVDTTMGFTALDGLVMGTRCGAIDPGILLYLQQTCGLNVKEVEHLLYYESGLKGVSEISGDMRNLLSSQDPRAIEAVNLFAFSVARETAAMAHTLGGLDCFIFTGGIGEHAAEVRAQVGARLSWLGVVIDRDANDHAKDRISDAASRVEVRIIPAHEELTIARNVLSLLVSQGH
jgi:acetate kinase